MASIRNGERVTELPKVMLDRTLSDLYRKYCPSLADQRIGHIFCGTTCAADLSDNFPRNGKYVYQDSAFNDASRFQKADSEVRKLLAPKYLSLVPQRDAFIAGDAPVLFFYSGITHDELKHDEDEAERTLAVLDKQQRPEIVFCSGPGHVAKAMIDHKIDAVTAKLVLDQVAASANVRKLVNSDKLWNLNSKEALSRSGLPTPAAKIIEVSSPCPLPSNCCEVCEAALDEGSIVIPEDCTGPRSRWLGEHSLKILTAIESQDLPFVFKNQQTFGGAGTYVITKGHERSHLIEVMSSGGILRRMLSHITIENEHLKPGTVLLTDMIKDPVADYGLTFFVGETGDAVYLAASEQIIDRENASWIGSTISYQQQPPLEKRFGPLINRVATYLHKEGYIGPAGIDVLQTRYGDFQIVDMNVRTSGSLCLPLLQKHFTSRGYDSASSLSVTVTESRTDFCKQWSTELQAGQMCILAWYEDDYAKKSFGDVVVAAEDDHRLAEMLEKVRAVSEQVTF